MMRHKALKGAAFFFALLFLLVVAAGPALARGGFSSGGRSSFSSSAGRSFSSGHSYSSGGRSFGGFFGSSKAPPAPVETPGPSSGTGGSSAGTSFGRGYSTGTGSFSTPRQVNPPTLYHGYSSGPGSYSTGQPGYNTGRSSYNGGGVPNTGSGQMRFPAKPPVGVFGPAPQPPAYYHNYYWGMPLWMHLFFQPNYYYTPWGYHFFAPRLLTWLALFCLGGLAVSYLIDRARRR